MNYIAVSEATYLDGYRISLTFNTGESGEVDLGDLIHRYAIAEPLRNPQNFARFYLDSWPTLAWECGFDVAPESLYARATGKLFPLPQPSNSPL
uniref:DUF2442 domain-containing protein n=1 Tax=Chlorobium chlorochromatii (strain CaD3) TaxID=340177 RepID=Q3ARP7_CHLCH